MFSKISGVRAHNPKSEHLWQPLYDVDNFAIALLHMTNNVFAVLPLKMGKIKATQTGLSCGMPCKKLKKPVI